MQTVRRRWRVHAVIILVYILLALALTWPLATLLDTHVPGNGVDDPPLTWNLWWVRYALLELESNPFACDYLFFPLGINLAFYTLTLLNGLLSIPLQASFGLVPASNIVLLSSFILSGYGGFLLAASNLAGISEVQTKRSRSPADSQLLAAFVAGILFAFASSKLTYAALGQWNIASSQWMPFYALYLFKTGQNPGRWRYPFMASLFLLLQAYAELTYATFLILFTGLWLVWHLVTNFRAFRSPGLWRPVVGVLLIGALFLVGLLPMLIMMVPDLLVEGDILVEGGGFADVFSADLLGFLIPTMYHPLFGSMVERFNLHHSVGQHIYLGYSALAIAAIGIVHGWRRGKASVREPAQNRIPAARVQQGESRWVTFWCLSATFFGLLTLGPTLHINGQDTGLPLPFALVAQLPFFKGNRYPSRYSVLLMLSLALLVAFGLNAILQRRSTNRTASWRPLPLFITALLLFEHLSVPLPLSDMRVPTIYQDIADQIPGDLALLDVPVAWRNGFRVTGTQHPTIMFQQYYQSIHGKRLLAGNTSRNPPFKFQYFTEAPVINTLIALETGHEVAPAVVEQDRSLATDVLLFFNVGAILVHPQQAGDNATAYIETTMPVEPFFENTEIVAFRVDLPEWPEAWTVEPGAVLSRLSYGEGWGVPANGMIWAQRRKARLMVPLGGGKTRMAFRAYAPEAGQRIRVSVNGQLVHTVDMGAGWGDYQVTLPGDTVNAGLNELWLVFETLYPARSAELGSRAIGQTGTDSPVGLVVQSAGQEVGDFGHIYVSGLDVSPGERGYNVAVLHPVTGVVEEVRAFDTHLDERASRDLTEFLEDIPVGRIVAVAAADEASRLLTQDAVSALRGIGTTGDLRGKFRAGHAVIGVRGAPSGTALEALDWMRPVTLAVGDGLTESQQAAAFATITFEAERND